MIIAYLMSVLSYMSMGPREEYELLGLVRLVLLLTTYYSTEHKLN